MRSFVFLFIFFMGTIFSSAQELIPFDANGLWGYKDLQGVVKITPQFQFARKFYWNMGAVVKHEKWGIIDSNNHILIDFKYAYLQPIDSAELLFGFKHTYFGEFKLGVIRKDEVVKIPAIYSSITKHKDRYFVNTNKDSIAGQNEVGDIRSVTTYTGMLDGNGQILIPCKFFSIRWFTDSLLLVDSAFAVENGKYIATHSAFFTKDGQQLSGFDYLGVASVKEGLAKARIGNQYGFVNAAGKVVIPITLEYCEEFNNGYALFKQKDKWGAIDKTGKVIYEAIHTYETAKQLLNQ